MIKLACGAWVAAGRLRTVLDPTAAELGVFPYRACFKGLVGDSDMAVRGPHTPWAMTLSTLEWKTTEEMRVCSLLGF